MVDLTIMAVNMVTFAYLPKVMFMNFKKFIRTAYLTIFSSGQLDYNGNECPVTCPTKCDGDDMWCYGGYDDNGCQMPDTCMPMKGGQYQEDIYYIFQTV